MNGPINKQRAPPNTTAPTIPNKIGAINIFALFRKDSVSPNLLVILTSHICIKDDTKIIAKPSNAAAMPYTPRSRFPQYFTTRKANVAVTKDVRIYPSKESGIDILVAGSAVFGGPSLKEAIDAIRNSAEK
jgi:hypothetical protein